MTGAAEELAPVVITDPGVYDDIPELDYHADPVPEGSLSHSGAKLLLQCPALFKHRRENPQPPKRQYDLGHAAHKLVLGVGLDIEVIEADTYRTKDAQERQKAAHARGAVPLLTHEWVTVQAMAAALREHPTATTLLAEGRGTCEASAFARDPETGVMLRCRYDHLPHPNPSGRLIVTDYKTAAEGGADPGAFGRAAATYGYAQQHPWYVDIARHLGLADDIAMVFVVQEKEAPYLVNVIELPADAVRAGRDRNRRAIDRFVECMTADEWPGYGTEVALARIPRWYLYETEDVTE